MSKDNDEDDGRRQKNGKNCGTIPLVIIELLFSHRKFLMRQHKTLPALFIGQKRISLVARRKVINVDEY